MKGLLRSKPVLGMATVLLIVTLAISFSVTGIVRTHAASAKATTSASPSLDCNGYGKGGPFTTKSPLCADFTIQENGHRVQGEDNGHYIGHDEPSTQFTSTVPGSGNNTQWQLTLPRERPLPATQSFENYVTYWFSMAICDPNSVPFGPCTPDSDKNTTQLILGDSGSALLELQFYPPGFTAAISCDATHWCAAMNIDSLTLNNGCFEPVNFAFIQKDGVPVNPPPIFTGLPNSDTLLMNQGDKLKVTIKDTPNGLLNRIDDLTTGQSGFMVASAANGFENTDPATCNQTPFSFHPEFSTAKFGNFVPWADLQANINVAYEIGHFQPGAAGDGDSDDAPCFPADPNPNSPTQALIAGCLGADLDFDGTSYQRDWADGTRNNAPSARIQSPLSGSGGPNGGSNYSGKYPIIQFETDVAASEPNCVNNPAMDGTDCFVPPQGANFYPFYSATHGLDSDAFTSGGSDIGRCAFLFGNNTRGVNDFGQDAEYGTPNVPWFWATFSNGPQVNPCASQFPNGN